MTPFARHAAFLFLALRAGDLVNLAAGMWLVPKFVSPEELGAVLPVTTFATLLALPVFAFGMAVTGESVRLARHGGRGLLKSLWRGVFIAVGILALLSLVLVALFLPRYLVRMRIADAAAGFFILAAALLGAVAPVYTDALQSVKRFRTLGAVELSAAVARFATMAALMPLRAFAGYFAGNAMQPVVRVAASILALRTELAVRAEHWWTKENTRTLFVRFGLTLLYLATPMVVANIEQDIVRRELPIVDSAAYYIVTRLSDLLNYLTFPLLLVLYPYAAEAGERRVKIVVKCSAVTLAAAILLGIVYVLWGRPILALVPNGEAYAGYAAHLPTLLAITALTACQTFYTNAEVASGRFSFLAWFIPTNAAYALALLVADKPDLPAVLTLFLLGAILRFACPVLAVCRPREPRHIA